jgi:hypothetical protein
MRHFLRSKSAGNLLCILIGAASLAWFLLRVIPKPSRAAYPCQRAAFPLASSFLIWLTGIFVSAGLIRKSRQYWMNARYGWAILFILAGLGSGAWFYLYLPAVEARAEDPEPAFVPVDGPNTPIGTGRGIFPGRVVWKHDPEATSWDGTSDFWWSEENTDQERVRAMLSESLRWLTEADTDALAWERLFSHYNQTHGRGEGGYRAGEKIAIKLNLNQISSVDERNNDSFTTPQLVLALLEQLVNEAGVSPGDITFYDALRVAPDVIVQPCQEAFPGVNFMDYQGLPGRQAANPDLGNPIPFSVEFDIVEIGSGGTAYVPTLLSEATYHINVGGLKGHTLAGVTFCGKNLFGSLLAESDETPMSASPKAAGMHPYAAVHDFGGAAGGAWSFDGRPMGSYNVIVDMMGHRDLGGKTILYLIDGLYATRHQSEPLGLDTRWSSPPFLDDWTSSLFISQDPVAIDSVALDFCRSESGMVYVYGNVDNYLHEAALASDSPSGTVYDPEDDGSPLNDLGVHEHWNNSLDKAYSRNFGYEYGVELVSRDPRIEWDIQLTPNPSEAGSTEGAGVFQNGYLVKIEALPNEGYRFSEWTGATGISDPQSAVTRVLVDAVKSIAANFILDSTRGYNDWIPVFNGETDILRIGPDVDFDKDGRTNFFEYAFVMNPTSPVTDNPILASTRESGGQRHLRLSFHARGDDPELQYIVQFSDNPVVWRDCAISCADGEWESSNPAALSILSTVSHGDGTWTLEVEDQTPATAGSPRFARLRANPDY